MISSADLRAHKAKLRGIMDSILGHLTFMGILGVWRGFCQDYLFTYQKIHHLLVISLDLSNLYIKPL